MTPLPDSAMDQHLNRRREFAPGEPGPSMTRRRMGGPGAGSGSKDLEILKDVLLLVTMSLSGDSLSLGVARTMVQGKMPDPSFIDHLKTEASVLPDLPPGHLEALQRLAGGS